jgi:hypothetical protein
MWNLEKRFEQLGGIKADGVGEVHELDNVNAPAAALHAGDKGL